LKGNSNLHRRRYNQIQFNELKIKLLVKDKDEINSDVKKEKEEIAQMDEYKRKIEYYSY